MEHALLRSCSLCRLAEPLTLLATLFFLRITALNSRLQLGVQYTNPSMHLELVCDGTWLPSEKSPVGSGLPCIAVGGVVASVTLQ